MTNTVLYLSMIRNTPSQARKLDGIRRYCSSRGWTAEPVYREDVSAETLPEILAKHDPLGCVVEGVASHALLPPGLFRGLPVSYVGYPRRFAGNRPNFVFDTEAIMATALEELSAGNPPCYAVVGFHVPWEWSRKRVRTFRAAAKAAGRKCLAFPQLPRAAGEPTEAYRRRLAAWLAKLPEHCAVFAVSDETAVTVVRAAKDAGRHIPRSLTLLSVDNFTELCEGADPPISSIQLDFEREGYLAAKALGETIATKNATGSRKSNEILGPLLVVRRKSTSGRGRHEKFVVDAIDMIRREACDGLSPASLIARFPVSKSLFNLRFREATGHSVLDEITHVRLEKATTLLARTDAPVGSVPALCGFACDRTLDAVFRSRFGMGMRQWRKRNSGRP